MTMKRFNSGLVLSLTLLVLSHVASQAETRCGPDYEPLRVKLNSPFGCVTENVFKRQMDKPSDLSLPRAETPPDMNRRIKTMSEWRQKKPAEAAIPEKPQ